MHANANGNGALVKDHEAKVPAMGKRAVESEAIYKCRYSTCLSGELKEEDAFCPPINSIISLMGARERRFIRLEEVLAELHKHVFCKGDAALLMTKSPKERKVVFHKLAETRSEIRRRIAKRDETEAIVDEYGFGSSRDDNERH